ncbi:hypothetical protein AB0C34_30985 [Nocardia sp. NPDC049220]
MVEPAMLAKTGLGVDDHQRHTVENFPHLRYVDRYAAAGIDLTTYVGGT